MISIFSFHLVYTGMLNQHLDKLIILTNTNKLKKNMD